MKPVTIHPRLIDHFIPIAFYSLFPMAVVSAFFYELPYTLTVYTDYLTAFVVAFVFAPGIHLAWILRTKIIYDDDKLFYRSMFHKHSIAIEDISKIELRIGGEPSNTKIRGFVRLAVIPKTRNDFDSFSINMLAFNYRDIGSMIERILETTPNITVNPGAKKLMEKKSELAFIKPFLKKFIPHAVTLFFIFLLTSLILRVMNML